MSSGLRVALVHDYLLTMRGAERTFLEIAKCWPDAPIFTSIFDEDAVGRHFESRDIHTSYLQKLGVRQRGFRRLLPLFPRAMESLPVSDFDLIVSSSSAFAHGVRRSPLASHVCYCHTPFRYAWHERERALTEVPRIARAPMSLILDRVQRWDLEASRGVTRYIANSAITRQRIASFYGRTANVVYPPVDVHRFQNPSSENGKDYFLYVGEVVSHKRVEVALEACRQTGKQLVVVGDGPERARLADQYTETAEFVGRVNDGQLDELLANCTALLVPNVEEFGIAAVEAQASGKPVVALGIGGATETIEHGTTGVLVNPGSVEAFAQALNQTDFESFDSTEIVRHACRFAPDRFHREIQSEVASE